MASVVFDTSDLAVGAVEVSLEAEGITLDEPRALRRTRFDTFDGRLERAGLQLEARASGTEAHALRLSGGDGPPAQLFLAVAVASEAPLRLDLLPRGPLRSRLETVTDGRALLPQVTVTSRRRSGTLTVDGIPRVSVHLDDGLSSSTPARDGSDGDRSSVEVETLPGRRAEAKTLRRQLARSLATTDGGAPAEPHDGDALRLAAEHAEVDLRGWRGPVRPELDRRAPALVGVRAVLRSFADALDANWQGAVDHVDDGFLHDLRISVRQTRSLLTRSRRVLPKEVRSEQRDAFRWLGTVTSPARDLDVYVAGWAELSNLLDQRNSPALEPVLAHLAGQRAEAHADIARTLGSRQARQLRADWRAWLDLPDDEVTGGRQANEPLGEVVGAWILAAQEQVITRGRAIDDRSPAEELHELRKDGKQLRYLLEGFGHLGGRKRSKATIAQLKRLQDNLGAHQDAEVQAARLRRALEDLSEGIDGDDTPGLDAATIAIGEQLTAALDQRQAEERARFAATFAAYDRKGARRQVRELVERMAR